MDATAATQADRLQTVGRLDELAVNEDVLRDAAQTGIEAAGTCTAHDPASLAGFLTWAKATRALRDELVPQGWSPGERRNYATVVNPSGTFAIAVAGGNAATGQREATLRTRTEKGPATKEAVKKTNSSASRIGTRPLASGHPRAMDAIHGSCSTTTTNRLKRFASSCRFPRESRTATSPLGESD